MRIQCESCGSPYELDNRLITEKGVRANCPKCRHSQQVRLAPRPVKARTAQTVVAPVPRSQAQPVKPQKAPASETTLVSKACERCGVPLTDPFDQALGVCDDCRQKLAPPLGPPPGAEHNPPSPAIIASAPAALPKPTASLKPIASPIPPVKRVSSPELPGPPTSAPSAFPVAPNAKRADSRRPDLLPELGALAPAEQKPRKTPAAGIPAASRSSRRSVLSSEPPTSSGSRWTHGALLGGLLAVLVFAAFALYFSRSEHKNPVASLPRPTLPRHTKETWPPRELAVIAAKWRNQLPNLSGSAQTYLQLGTDKLAEDQWDQYPQARLAFQKALVLNPSSAQAALGYAQALALGPPEAVDSGSYEDALTLVQSLEGQSKTRALSWLTHAELLLARAPVSAADLQQARQLAEQAQKNLKEDQQSNALVALGRAYLPSSASLAQQYLDQALSSEPPPPRAYTFRALAEEGLGNLPAAVSDLKQRLSLDPGNWMAAMELARIYAEVGQADSARATFDALMKQHPTDLRPALHVAILRYQAEGKPSDAAAKLRALLHNKERQPEVVAQAWVHLATAERLSGKGTQASKAAEEALKLPGPGVAAHWQMALLAVEGKQPEIAEAELQLVDGKMDAALFGMLKGRALFELGRYAQAYEAFVGSHRKDPRRLDALLYAGAAAAASNQREDSFRVLLEASEAEPFWDPPQPVGTLFYVKPGETLQGAAGWVEKLAHGKEDVMPLFYEGVIRFHQHDWAGADKLMQKVLDVDGRNAVALAFRALIAAEQKNMASAKTLASRAVELDREQILPHYALGLALTSSAPEMAIKELEKTTELSPHFLGAQLRLAQLQAKEGEPQVARERLIRVLGESPTYYPAKRALWALPEQRKE